MFSTVNHFLMFTLGSVHGRCGAANSKREPIKSLRAASNFTKVNIIQHAAEAFDRKYSDVTLFLITDIFKSNCDLITYSFLVTVTDYSYIYLVIK